MNRRTLIISVMGSFYAVQLALLLYALGIGDPVFRSIDLVVTLALSLAAAGIDAAVTRYVLKALERAQMSYAIDMSEQLRRSLDSYQQVVSEGSRETEELGRAIESELAKAREALAEGRMEHLEGHLREGLEIASEAHKPICSNAAVAAILDAKTRQCAASGVALEATVDLPDELPVPDVELAAIFFNLIDNALHECELLTEEGASGQKPMIDVRSVIEYGQLAVTVRNPCRTGIDVRKRAALRREQTGSSHGLGTDVVRTIADTHHGLATFAEEEGTFTASVMIPLH